MTVSASLASGDVAPLPAADAIPAFIFPSESGSGSVYQFDPGDNVYASTGSSDGTEGTYWFLRNAGQSCVVAVCAGTAGTKSAVTHVGTGPTVLAGYTGALTAPLLTTSFQGKILAGGLNGAALLGYCLDGSGDYTQYTATVPAEGPAVQLGTVALTDAIAASLDTLTLIVTVPAALALTVTFVTPVTPQDIADQINAAAIAGAKVTRAEIAETSAGLFLRLYTTSTGTGVDANSASLILDNVLVQAWDTGIDVNAGYYNKLNNSRIDYCKIAAKFDNCYNIAAFGTAFNGRQEANARSVDLLNGSAVGSSGGAPRHGSPAGSGPC